MLLLPLETAARLPPNTNKQALGRVCWFVAKLSLCDTVLSLCVTLPTF